MIANLICNRSVSHVTTLRHIVVNPLTIRGTRILTALHPTNPLWRDKMILSVLFYCTLGFFSDPSVHTQETKARKIRHCDILDCTHPPFSAYILTDCVTLVESKYDRGCPNPAHTHWFVPRRQLHFCIWLEALVGGAPMYHYSDISVLIIYNPKNHHILSVSPRPSS